MPFVDKLVMARKSRLRPAAARANGTRSQLRSIDILNSIAAVPTRGYLLVIILAIGFLLFLSGDFGRSWDISFRERDAVMAYNFYSKGFDAAQLRAEDPGIYYGAAIDLVIKIAQETTSGALQKLRIRNFLQALMSLSCLIPVFLISARILPKPLALISVALLAATPVFFGHAFINPKDSIFASGFVWAFYLILYCFDDSRKPNYRTVTLLGALLGLVVSIRFTGAYLLLLILIAAIVLPARRQREDKVTISLPARLWEQVTLQYRGLVLLLVTFALAYALLMPGLLANFSLQTAFKPISNFLNYPFLDGVLYFGEELESEKLPWHYIYGYMIVQLPLYYHLFCLAILVVAIAEPCILYRLRDFWRIDERSPTVILLIAAVVVPLFCIILVRPPFYDGFRQVLFMVPLMLMVLYFGFMSALKELHGGLRGALVLLASLGFMQAILAMRALHPYEYVYYNPLVKPAGAFELDYWGTSFREMAQRLNEYARQNTRSGEKLRLYVCGPAGSLTPFLDADKFKVVGETENFKVVGETDNFKVVEKDGAPQFTVALNRWGCMKLLNKPWLIWVGRGDLIFAAAALNASTYGPTND